METFTESKTQRTLDESKKTQTNSRSIESEKTNTPEIPLQNSSTHIVCECGNTYLRSEKFSIYDWNFCSMECLRNSQKVSGRKRKENPVAPEKYRPRFDCGGPNCF
jgi:hypothetical protein